VLRFLVRSLLLLTLLAGATLATIRAGSTPIAVAYFSAALAIVAWAVWVAVAGRGRRRAFARGFALAAGSCLLLAALTPFSLRWSDPMVLSRLALWLFVQLQRTREAELRLILATLDVAAALALGWLGGGVASRAAAWRER
jgi:hypothetical protein